MYSFAARKHLQIPCLFTFTIFEKGQIFVYLLIFKNLGAMAQADRRYSLLFGRAGLSLAWFQPRAMLILKPGSLYLFSQENLAHQLKSKRFSLQGKKEFRLCTIIRDRISLLFLTSVPWPQIRFDDLTTEVREQAKIKIGFAGKRGAITAKNNTLPAHCCGN